MSDTLHPHLKIETQQLLASLPNGAADCIDLLSNHHSRLSLTYQRNVQFMIDMNPETFVTWKLRRIAQFSKKFRKLAPCQRNKLVHDRQ